MTKSIFHSPAVNDEWLFNYTGIPVNHDGVVIFMVLMNCTATHFPYRQTGYFSKIILDYLDESESLQQYYQHPVSMDGIKSAIQLRQSFSNDRKMLVEVLNDQYGRVDSNAAVNENINKLLNENCFTVTTAHQPAIFTGSLYFIYKIIHAIKLAANLSRELPQYHFVPIFYMGSEDADLDELGKIYLDREVVVWKTEQTGAVGRMNTKGLEKIIDRIEGEFGGLPFGSSLIETLKKAYGPGNDIQTATFKLLHELFSEYGLVILIPDESRLKRPMAKVFADDLFEQKPSSILEKTIQGLSMNYKVQANPRDINLFYLKDDLRERIIQTENRSYKVHGTDIMFSEGEMKAELENYPERFSPNVILRGLYQETILPNIAFIGGSGETAYWLEFKELFAYYQVPFPVLLLRNSFLISEKKWNEKLEKMDFSEMDIFKPEENLMEELVKRESHHQLKLEEEMMDVENFYKKLKNRSLDIDTSLAQHVEALSAKAIRPLKELEKKILKAEKRRFEDQRRQIQAIKSALFPLDGLQERIGNFLPYYAQWGKLFFKALYQHSLTLEQQFTLLKEI